MQKKCQAFCFSVALLFFYTSIAAAEDARSPSGARGARSVFELTSTAFTNDGAIPVQYTCRGSDVNPPLDIRNIPLGTKSMALTVHDPFGPIGVWSHWVVFNIKPDTMEITENSVPGRQALNDFGNFYYGGPCPADEREHRYIFTLYALNAYLVEANEGATLDSLQKVISGKIIAKTELVGTFQNPKWLKE